jgi:hypothetical protein
MPRIKARHKALRMSCVPLAPTLLQPDKHAALRRLTSNHCQQLHCNSCACSSKTPLLSALLLLLPKVFSPLYVMYRKPSSSLWSSYTDDISAAAHNKRSKHRTQARA